MLMGEAPLDRLLTLPDGSDFSMKGSECQLNMALIFRICKEFMEDGERFLGGTCCLVRLELTIMFSDYIVYVDESGNHGLEGSQESYPVFVLSCCIFRTDEYSQIVVPAFLNLKFRFFGHDMVVLHSNEIRKESGPFKILVNANLRKRFMEELETALIQAPLTLVASLIDKRELLKQYATPGNPYEIALRFCLERTFAFLRDHGQGNRPTTVVVECRGRVEDDALELAFRRIVAGDNRWGPIPLEIVFADKKTNSTGLQIADLVSHPIGRHHLNPAQPNRAYDVIAAKFCGDSCGEEKDRGLKIFP
jgi:hypothetical protein